MLRQGIHGFPKNVSPFGPAVWPAVANIQTNEYERSALLYRRLLRSITFRILKEPRIFIFDLQNISLKCNVSLNLQGVP